MILRPQACLWAKLPPPLRFLQKVWSGGAGGLGWGAGGGVGEAEWLPRDTRDRSLLSSYLASCPCPSIHPPDLLLFVLAKAGLGFFSGR